MFGGQEKILDINIEEPKMVWIKKDFDNYTPYTNIFYRDNNNYNIIEVARSPIDEVFIKTNRIPNVSFGTFLFRIRRLYAGTVSIFNELTITYEKKLI